MPSTTDVHDAHLVGHQAPERAKHHGRCRGQRVLKQKQVENIAHTAASFSALRAARFTRRAAAFLAHHIADAALRRHKEDDHRLHNQHYFAADARR